MQAVREDGRRARGDTFSHVVLRGSGFSRDLTDDRSKEWMIGSRLVVSGLLFLSKYSQGPVLYTTPLLYTPLIKFP